MSEWRPVTYGLLTAPNSVYEHPYSRILTYVA